MHAQQRGGTPQTDTVQPVNSGANPYRVIRDWAQLTIEAGRGAARTVWPSTATADRCGPWIDAHRARRRAVSAARRTRSTTSTSQARRSAASAAGCSCGRMASTSIATATCGWPTRGEKKDKGSVVIKFSPEGKVLMTLGKPGVRGNPPEALDRSNRRRDRSAKRRCLRGGESHRRDRSRSGRAHLGVRQERKFLRVIGRTGTGPGEFRTPHALEFDSQGRLIVADRHNHRIQILTKEGKFIAEYAEFGRTSGLAIDANDVIYTADSESNERVHPGWQRGIRIGSLKDGKVTIFIPPHAMPNSPRRRDGRRHRDRRRRQHLHRGSAAQRHHEIRSRTSVLRLDTCPGHTAVDARTRVALVAAHGIVRSAISRSNEAGFSTR